MGSNYPGKGETGYVNMEFEAWLYTDLWASGRNVDETGHSSWINNAPGSLKTPYFNWINKITGNYGELSNSTEYLKWLKIFHDNMPAEYRSAIDFGQNKIPCQMINAFKFCTPIN